MCEAWSIEVLNMAMLLSFPEARLGISVWSSDFFILLL